MYNGVKSNYKRLEHSINKSQKSFKRIKNICNSNEKNVKINETDVINYETEAIE